MTKCKYQQIECGALLRPERKGVGFHNVAFAALLTLAACKSGGANPATDSGPDSGGQPVADAAAPDAADPWLPVRTAIDDHEIPNLTLLVGDASGTLMVYEKGNSTAATEYRIASATKWVMASTIMRLVEKGDMALDDNPQDYLVFWTDSASDVRSDVTLDQLLSFTSGFRGRPALVPCVSNANTTIAACVPALYASYHAYEPGSTFFYGPAHMHTAARMAEVRTGKSWPQIVEDEIFAPLGVADTVSWALTSEMHPMPSGGIRTSGATYARFLQSLLSNDMLTSQTLADMAVPRTITADIGFSPIRPEYGAWTYGLGQWRECGESTFTQACEDRVLSSSLGAFGFYPWLDHDRGYWAVLAMELSTGADPSPVARSLPLGQELMPLIEQALAQMQLKNASSKVSGFNTVNTEKWLTLLEEEYEQLISSLNEWSVCRNQWIELQKASLVKKLEDNELFHRLKQLEADLDLRRQQWRMLTQQFA